MSTTWNVVEMMKNMDDDLNFRKGVVLAAKNRVLKAIEIQAAEPYAKNIDTLEPKSPTPIHTYVIKKRDDGEISQRVFFSLAMTCEEEDGTLKLYGGVLYIYLESGGNYVCSLCFSELPHIDRNNVQIPLDVYDHAQDLTSELQQNDFESATDMIAEVMRRSFPVHLNTDNLHTISISNSPEDDMPLQ